jgi:hypothetical protein
VFEVVTPVFENVVVFVLDLPAGSASSDDQGDVSPTFSTGGEF